MNAPATPAVPTPVSEAIERLRAQIVEAAGANLEALVLYGGLARGRFRPGRSDVNIVIVLKEDSARSLDAIAPALSAARRTLRAEPMILTLAEVGPAAASFPTKFLDIQAHHVVLAGRDPFVNLDVPRERLLWSVEQDLRNMAMRLRRRYVAVAGDAGAGAIVLGEAARPLAIALASLLRLSGQPVPSDDRTSTIFDEAAKRLGLDHATLAELATLRRTTGTGPGAEPGALLDRTVRVILKAAQSAAGLGGQGTREPRP